MYNRAYSLCHIQLGTACLSEDIFLDYGGAGEDIISPTGSYQIHQVQLITELSMQHKKLIKSPYRIISTYICDKDEVQIKTGRLGSSLDFASNQNYERYIYSLRSCYAVSTVLSAEEKSSETDMESTFMDFIARGGNRHCKVNNTILL